MRKLDTLVENDNRSNNYLDAILNACKSAGGDFLFQLLHECVHFSPDHYFIKEVTTSYDKADLYKTWPRVNMMRSSHERNTWLENMTWRGYSFFRIWRAWG
ncbi:putative sucrose-phosphate synthase 2 [Hordeum vulgare]|nr:putative sucrose-phosphate synthase 2 [Hordeum vulgare]